MAKSKKTKRELAVTKATQIDEAALFRNVSAIIENRTTRARTQVNQESVLMFWEVGHAIGTVLLGGERADYGKRIVVTLSQQLQTRYGSSFAYTNVTRMMKFSSRFPDVRMVAPLAQQLSWSHVIALLPLKNDEAFMFYASDAAARRLGLRDLRLQIARKAYERREIANTQLSTDSTVPFNVFKDPYILDVLGLKENFLEADLEKAILVELEAFLLEFGNGLTFAERQKRMTMDGEDFTLDLLFYHRDLRRLVAVELKIGRFRPRYMGQMRFYLKWLDRHERRAGEESPIGIILCTTASRDQIEMLELDKEGIAVAEYWTALPPKAEFERKIKEILAEARERLERRKSLPQGETRRQLEYFYEPKEDEDEEGPSPKP